MKWSKKWGCIFAIIIVCLIICIFPWSYKIDTTLQGIQYRIGDEDYSEDVIIKAKGVYKQYLIKEDTFEGIISIDIYDFTHEVPIGPERFYDGNANLTYQNMHSLGFFICTPDFDKLLIGINEPIGANSSGWSSKNGLIICAPADNREQGLEITKVLSTKSKWLSQSKWSE